MSIPVTCSCGKSMRAPIEWAGRNAKCPSCGQSVHIPGHGPAPTAPAPTSKLPVAPCSACGKPLMVPPGMAGKLVACPACGSHVTLPGGKSVEVTARAPAVTVPHSAPKSKSPSRKKQAQAVEFEMDSDDDDRDRRDDRDDGDDDDRRSSRRDKKRKSGKKAKAGGFPVLLVAGIGGGGLLVLLLVVALLFVFRGGGGGSTVLAMVPADADVVVHARVGDFLQTASGQKIRKMAVDLKKDLKVGLELDNFRDVVVFGNTTGQPLIVVSTYRPIDTKGTENDLVNTHTKKVLEGKAFLAPNQPMQPGFFFHGSQTLILGAENDIANYLKKPPATEGPMAASIRAAGSDSSMFFVAVRGSALKQGAGDSMNPMAMLGGFPDIKTIQVTLSDGSRISGNLALEFSDAAGAGKAKEQLDVMLGLAKQMAPQQMKMVPVPGMADMVEKALARAKPALSGTTVNVPIEVETTMGDLAEKMQPFLAMMAMGAGPGMGGPGMGGPGIGLGPGIGPGPGPIGQPKVPVKKRKI